MTLQEAFAALQEEPLPRQTAAAWEASQAHLPAERPAFLSADRIRDAWAYGRFAAPLPPELVAMADRIAGDEALRRWAWHAVWSVFEGPREAVPSQWPELRNHLGADAGLFWLIAALPFIPAVRAYHATLRLPEAVTRDTCLQVACFALNHRRGCGGRWGLYRGQFGWLANYLAPSLYFRIGRFEYWRRPYTADYRVYRHRATGAVAALAADGVLFSAAGDRCFRDDDPTPAGSWRAALAETPAGVTGHAISPRGTAMPRTVCLPAAEWTCALKAGDPVLDMHIPAGGHMTPEACARSFRDAVALFRTRFPEPAPRAIACASWMFSNQLEDCLPADANLVRLLREVYLLPHPCRPNDSLWFVFLQDRFDPATAPRDTSLQRALLDYLGRGHEWHTGGMFLLCDDVPRVGTQPYRQDSTPGLRHGNG